MTEKGRKEKDLPIVEDFTYVRGIDNEGRSANIPKSLFGGNLDVASENVLGGVKASPREAADTNEVKIDPNTGKLYCPPSEVAMATAEKIGGIVAEVKTSEETEEVKIDPNTGKAYVKKDQGNPPDEEDITTVSVDGSKVLQFKNRGKDKGMGYVILRSNKTIAEQMIQDNTIYEIRYDFDLNGKPLEVPANCVLKFEGGKLFNGSIKGNYTVINSKLSHIFDAAVTFSGTFDIESWYPEWFGAKSNDSSYMSTMAIQAAIEAAKSNIKVVELNGANYCIDDTLIVYPYQTIRGGSSSPHHYGGINITQTVNKNAIHITSTDTNIWQICLKDFTIYNQYKGEDMNNCGIYVNNNNVQTYFYHNEINNVCCCYFDKGFMYDGYGDGAFAYNYFYCFNLYYNKIGFYVKGNLSSDTSVTKYPWANLNKWDFCKFMQNSVGGIYFHNTRSQQENVFTSCAIEGNGLNYTLKDYDDYGCAGWAFRGYNKSTYGYTRFINCYIEYNLPRRKEALGYNADREYVFAGYCYPNDIEENVANACFNCYKQNIEVRNCLLSKYALLYQGKLEFSIDFSNNDYDAGKPWYNSDSKVKRNYFFYFDWNYGYTNYISIDINEKFPKGDRDSSSPNLFTQLTSVYRLSDDANKLTARNIKMNIVHPLLDEPIIYKSTDANNKAEIESGVIYIDPSKPNDNTGATKIQPVGSFTLAELNTSFYKKGKTVNWVLLGNYAKTATDNWGGGTITNDIYLKGVSGVVYSATARKTLYTSWIIDNITFDVSTPQYQHLFESYANRIEFRNCTFNLPNVLHNIARLMYGGDIVFVNCKFNVSDDSKGNIIRIQNTSYQSSNIVLSGCTIQDGYSVPRNTNFWYHGNPVYKSAGEVISPDTGGFCLYDGDNVINPDGTLYSKVRRNIGDISKIQGSTNVVLNRINVDIDLNGETFTLPSNSRLDFQGGKIINGTINFNNATLLPMGMPLSYYIDTKTVTTDENHFAEGQVLYDSSLKKQKLWNGSEWVNLDGTSLS